MRRQHAMNHRQSSHQRDADFYERHSRAARDREHQWNQEDEAHLKEHRDPDNESDHHDRPVHPPLAKQVDERRRNARGRARLRHHPAEHRPKTHDDCDEPECPAYTILKRFHRRARLHARGDSHRERDGNQRYEWMKLESRDEDDERDDRQQREKKQAGFERHADARFTRSATIASGVSLISNTHALSSASGSSSVASWLSSRVAGMKCPLRLASRSTNISFDPRRRMKRTSSASARRISR